MGMFDYLKVEMPLPGLTPEQVARSCWQTKDTPAQYMERYRLTSDGKLMHTQVAYDITPEAELGSLGERELAWSGTLEFHGGPGDTYICFEAWFKNGVCVDIQRLFTPYDREPE